MFLWIAYKFPNQKKPKETKWRTKHKPSKQKKKIHQPNVVLIYSILYIDFFTIIAFQTQ